MSIHESTAAYLLGALPDGERAEFEAHLSGCDACRQEIAQLRVAADALPVGVEQFAAPPAIKDRLMATVRAEAELLTASGAQADRLPARSRTPRERRRRFAWRPALAFACILAIGVVAGALLNAGDGGPGSRTVVASLAPRGAAVTLEMRDEHSTLLARNLPAPPSGRVYQVWLKRKGVKAPEPTDALFTPRDGSASVDVPGSLTDVEAVLVTHEPKSGSKVPSVPPLIAVST